MKWPIVGTSLILASSAAAQCPEWVPHSGEYRRVGPRGDVQLAMAVVDHDGTGPKPPVVYRSEMYTSYQWSESLGVSAYVPNRSDIQPPVPLGTGLYGASSLLGLDEEVLGISAGTLVMSSFYVDPTNRRMYITAWDGQTLRPLGPTGASDFSGVATALAAWSLDGIQTPRLIAGGSFSRFGGTDSQRVSSWDGQVWSQLADGLPANVFQFSVHDFDGDGPQPARLVATIDHADGVRVCDGNQWSSLGAIRGKAIAVHDPDGPGPNPAMLYIAGTGLPVPGNIRRWTGSDWEDAGHGWPQLPSGIEKLLSADLDGDGPSLPILCAGGDFYSWLAEGPLHTFAILTDSGWHLPQNYPYDSTIHSPSGHRYGLRDLAVFDPDGDGPRQSVVMMSGGTNLFAGDYYPCEATSPAWDGERFVHVQNGLGTYFPGSSTPRTMFNMATFDLDGPGPEPTRLYATGLFFLAGGMDTPTIAAWQDDRWQRCGDLALNQIVGSRWLIPHDPDGDGPEIPWMVGMGRTSYTEVVARYTGSNWVGVGGLINSAGGEKFFHMRSFPADASGTGPPTLFAVGVSTFGSAIMRFNGTQWSPAGTPPSETMYWLESHDPDGDGPGAPMLLALGISGTILRWNGTNWTSFVQGVSVQNYTDASFRWNSVSWDTDGQGPLPTELVLCADRITTPNGVFRIAAAFNGTTWRGLAPLPTAALGAIRSAYVIDLDGPGFLPKELFVCGTSGIGRLHNGVWTVIPFVALGLAGHTPGVEGPGPGEIFVVGEFTSAGGVNSEGFARLRFNDPVTFEQHPANAPVAQGATATFTVTAHAFNEHYQWRRNGQSITDEPGGASSGGGTVTGAATRVLSILDVQCSDSGVFTCVVTNACGPAESNAGLLSVQDCPCNADVNCDNLQNADDLATIERAVGGDLSDCCLLDVDFNADFALDGFDVEAVAAVIQGGPCP